MKLEAVHIVAGTVGAVAVAWVTMLLLDRRRPVAATLVVAAAVTASVAVWAGSAGL